MEAWSTSETSVNFYQTTRRNNPFKLIFNIILSSMLRSSKFSLPFRFSSLCCWRCWIFGFCYLSFSYSVVNCTTVWNFRTCLTLQDGTTYHMRLLGRNDWTLLPMFRRTDDWGLTAECSEIKAVYNYNRNVKKDNIFFKYNVEETALGPIGPRSFIFVAKHRVYAISTGIFSNV
jgi:hypothetical protein